MPHKITAQHRERTRERDREKKNYHVKLVGSVNKARIGKCTNGKKRPQKRKDILNVVLLGVRE